MIKISYYVFMLASEGVRDGLVQVAWHRVDSPFMDLDWKLCDHGKKGTKDF